MTSFFIIVLFLLFGAFPAVAQNPGREIGLKAPAPSFGLKQLDSIADIIAPEGPKPEFTKTIETKRFTVRYTDSDLEASHNITADKMQPVLADLDRYYEKYLRTFKAINPTPPVKPFIDVYNFALDPRFASYAAFTWPLSISVNVLPEVFDNPCLARYVISHELFHRVEAGHKLDARALSTPGEAYWVEGMAEWATLFSTAQATFLDSDPQAARRVFEVPNTPLTLRGYDASLFWVYLDERYRELHGPKSAGKVIDDLLNQRGKGKRMFSVLRKTLSDLVKAERKKSRAGAVRGISNEASFLQDWHVANLNAALNLKSSRKLGYQPLDQKPDACGTIHVFATIAGKGGPDITSNDTAFASDPQAGVGYGGADYYQFPIGAEVTSMRLKVIKKGGGVISVVRGTGSRITPVETTGGNFDRTINFKPGTTASVFVIIGGADKSGRSTSYQLTVNGGQVAQPSGTLRVKVIATFSDDAGSAAGERRAMNVKINNKAVATGTEQEGSTTVGAGIISVSVDPAELEDGFGNLLRVGFITVQFSRSGQIFLCGPTSRTGDVTFPAQVRDSNPDSSFDYSVGVRVVPQDAPALENLEPGCSPQV